MKVENHKDHFQKINIDQHHPVGLYCLSLCVRDSSHAGMGMPLM
jgi:hypothetical protein